MDYLKQFSIPFKGMLDGVHQYGFDLEEDFFSRFPESPIGKCRLRADFQTDKQGSIMTVDLRISGTAVLPCDRCLADIDLPVRGDYRLILKQAVGTPDDPDLYFIGPDDHEWNIAEVLYEYSCLSVPMSRRIECESMDPAPCNREVLGKFEEDKENFEQNPLWDELKKLNLK